MPVPAIRRTVKVVGGWVSVALIAPGDVVEMDGELERVASNARYQSTTGKNAGSWSRLITCERPGRGGFWSESAEIFLCRFYRLPDSPDPVDQDDDGPPTIPMTDGADGHAEYPGDHNPGQ